jgi:nitroimidazol reductase NimA-like FMN-containing flavoprotein (pyridoxamine 5'-phosphate oxidase superfamily)
MTTPDRDTSEHDDHEDGGVGPSAQDRELMEIGEEECFALLQRQEFGRLAIVRDGQPDIFPVNYALDGHTIMIRTQPGVKLTYATLARVAFEVEDIDPVSREGWVVVAHGLAEDITDAIDRSSEHARATVVRPWVMGPHEHYIAIERPQVSGRRLLRRPPQHP